jgi:tetratricopeptide (TPR) repeat protein
MPKLLSIVFTCFCLSISASCPLDAEPTGVDIDQAPITQHSQSDYSDSDTSGVTVVPLPNSANDYADKTNAAAQLCREARQFSDNNQQEQARTVLERAGLLDPNGNSAVVHNQLGLAFSRLGNPNAALSEFNRALSFSSQMPAVTLNIAECYKQLGQIDQAKFYLKSFIDENPNSPQVSEAKSSLNALRHTAKITGDTTATDYLDSVTKKGIIGWSQQKMPIKVFIEDGRDIFGYQDLFSELVQKSLWQWAQASNRALFWRIVPNRSQADIAFHWTSDRSDFPHGAEQGIAKLTWKGHCIQHVNVTICTVPVGLNETKPLSANEMEQTCLHEIGHALGLTGHSSNNNDVMFFCVRPYPVTQLTERDKNAIARLYSNNFVEPRNGGGVVTVGIPGLFGIRF